MSLLHNIQKSITEQNKVAPILLQLRVLATKIGSEQLEDWIKFESEGYPDNVTVPNYRKAAVSYTGNFIGPGYCQAQNIQISSYTIKKFVGDHWINIPQKQSMDSIDNIVSQSKDFAYIDASDLPIFLHDKVLKNYTCISITGKIGITFFTEIQNTVRNKILDFVVQLEKSVPGVVDIDFSHKIQTNSFADKKEKINHITNQTIYKDCTFAHSNHNSGINISVIEGDKSSLINFLIEKHFPIKEAEEFADIVASEKPTNKNEPFGKKTKQWLDENLEKTSKLCQTTMPILELIKKAVSAVYGM